MHISRNVRLLLKNSTEVSIHVQMKLVNILDSVLGVGQRGGDFWSTVTISQ